MTELQYFYRKDTLQIDAVYKDAETESSKYKDADVYVEVNVVDPGYAVTRDHKVILDAEGAVVGTEASVNPVQPVETVELSLCQHLARVSAFSVGVERPLKVVVSYRGVDFPLDCYVSQDLVDAYGAGQLVVGDFVVIDFLEGHEDKPLAAQKIFKTW